MKLRHLLFGLLAGVAFVACTNDDDPAGASPVNGGNKVATAPKYMTVNFVTSDGASTRADDDAEGTEEESTINSAAFLFFKNGAQVADPFVLKKGDPDAVTDQSLSQNWTDTSDAVVVLENPSDIPTSMVVLVNVDLKVITGQDYNEDGSISDAQKTALKTKTIDNLQAAAAFETPTAKGPFKMTNAVYNEGGQNVIGAPVGADNVKETPADARQNPVKVYIEREAAKVSVKNSATENTIQPGENFADVKITLKNWALVFENTKSSLIKNLGTSYNFGWT